MAGRMLIGNIDRCLEVVREVWWRRDRDEEGGDREREGREMDMNMVGRGGGGEEGYDGYDDVANKGGGGGYQDGYQGWTSDLPPSHSPSSSASALDPTTATATTTAPSIHDHGIGHGIGIAGRRGRAGMGMAAGGPVPVPVLRLPRERTDGVDVVEELEFEKTVRGRLHWVGVMRDWRWEGQSSFFRLFPRLFSFFIAWFFGGFDLKRWDLI